MSIQPLVTLSYSLPLIFTNTASVTPAHISPRRLETPEHLSLITNSVKRELKEYI